MNPISNVKTPDRPPGSARGRTPRTYDSPLREEQARRTRERILDALIRIMAKGIAEVSMPAVAREAGVSVPTVYRHFGSKRQLVSALGDYLLPRTGLLPDRPPSDLAAIVDTAQRMYRRYERMDATIRAAMASQLGGEIRREHMPERIAYFRAAVQGSRPDLDPESLDRFAAILVILFSSAAMRAFSDYLGLSADEAADHVVWAIQHLSDGL